jgi:hypothetical protein
MLDEDEGDYLDAGLGDLWKVAKQWLDLKGVPTPP